MLSGKGHEEKETTPVDRNMKYKMRVGGGKLVDTIRNKENVISLKSTIKDPSFVQKIGQLEELEDRRQQLYLNILMKRGQIVVAPDGAQTIVSYPKVLYTNLWWQRTGLTVA